MSQILLLFSLRILLIPCRIALLYHITGGNEKVIDIIVVVDCNWRLFYLLIKFDARNAYFRRTILAL